MNLSYSEYKAIVEFSPNMIWRAGLDAECNYFNETWLRFTGRTLEQEVGNGWAEGVHPEDLDFCVNKYRGAFSKRQRFEMEYRLRRHDGKWRWINDRGIPFFSEDGSFIGFIGSCMDVTEKIEGRKLTEMAHNDQLTGLYNRNYLEYLLSYEFRKAQQEQSDFVIIMMDIDKFKFINDKFGHNDGDRALNQVARSISANIRKTDIAGRYGGDEFLIILPKASADEAQQIAQRILDSVPKLVTENSSMDISLSIGIAKKTDEEEASVIVQKADKAMYFSKQNGGRKYSLYSD